MFKSRLCICKEESISSFQILKAASSYDLTKVHVKLFHAKYLSKVTKINNRFKKSFKS